MGNDLAQVDVTLAAVADPTRRAVVDLLGSGPKRAGELAASVGMSGPAMSRHLRVLRESGLVEAELVDNDARLRMYRLRPQSLVALQAWLDQVEAFWSEQLGSFKAHAERTRKKPAVSDGVATAIVEVDVDPPTAFEVFTEEVAAWWRASESVRFEPGVGGRVLALAGEPETPPIEVGRVLVWEPGPRLAFTYRGDTEVEVRFEAAEHGTRVVLEHRGFDRSLVPDLSDDWAGLLDRFAERSRERVLLGRLAEFVTAIAENDVEFFRENMTDDAMCVFPGVDGVYDREQTAAGMADHPPYVKYLLEDPRVIDAGPTAAVLMARGVIQRIDDATPRSWVVSNTFVNRDGIWKLAFVQWTPV